MNQKPNLLIVTSLYPLPWEKNRATDNWQQFEHLKLNYNVAIVVPVAWPEYVKNLSAKNKKPSVKYVPYFYIAKLGSRYNSLFMYKSVSLLAISWIKAFKPDHILGSCVYPTGEVVRRLSKTMNVPYSIKTHGSDLLAHLNNPVRVELIKSVLNYASSIFTVSNHLKGNVLELIGFDSEQKVKTVYNGIDKTLFDLRNHQPKTQRLIYVGYLKRTNGIMDLLSAFKNVMKNHPCLTLDIVGEGEALKEVANFIEDNNLSDNVVMYGAIQHGNINAFIKEASLLVLPSHSEGLPNILLESISCGVPVVASDVGGIPEIIQEGVNGFLCTPKDTHIIAERIEEALNHRWVPSEIRETVASFCWQENRKQVTELLSRVA